MFFNLCRAAASERFTVDRMAIDIWTCIDRSLAETLSALVDRASDAPKLRKDSPGDELQVKFPVIAKKIPVPQNIFPVNLHRELSKNSLQHSGFSLQYRPLEPQNRKIPCKIPC